VRSVLKDLNLPVSFRIGVFELGLVFLEALVLHNLRHYVLWEGHDLVGVGHSHLALVD
jgi:hypothetical protein